MRKDRNTFFQEAQSSSMGYMPNQNMMPNGYPYQATQASNTFYAGPDLAMNMNNDLESRLAKIERQIHRLESRVSKLETNLPLSYTSGDDIDVTTNSMYMI